MSKLYVPPGMDYKKYMNLATINGIDVGVSTPTYGNGASIRDFTVANALCSVKAFVPNLPPTPENGWALEFTNYGSKLSFQLNEPSIVLFETFITVNPVGSTYKWSNDGDWIDIFLVHSTLGELGYASVRNPADQLEPCGPFVYLMDAQIPDGQSDLYICAWWDSNFGTPTGIKQIAIRVNVLGFLQ